MSDTSEPESGGGRSAGPSFSKASKPGTSYAAIGLLKENMQAAIGRRPGDASKGLLEHDSGTSRTLAGELSGNFRSFSTKSDLQQRTGPTKEIALLRAELELLRGHNAELAARLQLTEGQLSRHNRQLLQSQSSPRHQQDEQMSSAAEALQDADTQHDTAQECCMRATLQEQPLQPDEVEAAALQCTWLAHYWELAQQFGLYPEIAASRAAHWRALALPTTAIVQSAQHVCTALQQRKGQALHGDSSSSGSSSTCAAGLKWLSNTAGPGVYTNSLPATAADLVGIERGARQLQELGVEAAVLAAISQRTAARRTMLQLPPAFQDGSSALPLLSALVSPEEEAELQLQQAYLAFVWGRAALMGVEPQVSVVRAEQWHCRMDSKPTIRDFEDVRQSFQELRIRSIEQQMWQQRRGSGMQSALPASSVSTDCQTTSMAATAAAQAAAAAAAAAQTSEAAAGRGSKGLELGSADLPVHPDEALQLSPSLLPFAVGESSTVSDGFTPAKPSVPIIYGIMSLPALSFPGSPTGSGVPVSIASKAAGLRTG